MQSPIKPNSLPWSEIETFFRHLADNESRFEPMLLLVRALAASATFAAIYRWTSHADLVLARNAGRPMDDDRLTISFDARKNTFLVTLRYAAENHAVQRSVALQECAAYLERLVEDAGWDVQGSRP